MLKKSLLIKLYSYNMHLGSNTSYNSRLNHYIFGKRFNFYIINMNKSFLLLKKVLFFLNMLAANNGSLLMHYSNYLNLNIIYKCVLLSITKRSNQQIITYNWVYGRVGNFFFSFYLLLKEITSAWVKRHNYLFNFEKKINPYYQYNFEGNTFEFFDYLFLKRIKPKKWWLSNSLRRHTYKTFNNWYIKWVKSSSTNYKYWTFQTNATRYTNFFKKISLNDINNVWKTKKVNNFKYIFLKLFYYIYLKKQDAFTFNIYSLKTNEFSSVLHKKFQSYWRFILYFKYFNNYFNVPDALFSIFPNKDDLPSKEFSSAGLISIGLIDTDCPLTNVNYPIISNDDSLVIVLFYFTLFSNIFLENQLNMYNLFNFQNRK